MAEQTPGIANKKLLVIAIVLAAVAAVFSHLRSMQVEKAARGQTKVLLRFVRDVESGQRIERKDIEPVEVETRVAEGLGKVLTDKDSEFAVDRVLNAPVRKGDWLLWSQVTASEENSPAAQIRKGMVKYSFPIDPDQSAVEELRAGDRVNIMGMLELERDPLQAYRIIENVKVMEVASKRKVVVEVTPEVAQQLPNIRTHARGDFWVEVRNPGEQGEKSEINEKLRDLKAAVEAERRPAK